MGKKKLIKKQKKVEQKRDVLRAKRESLWNEIKSMQDELGRLETDVMFVKRNIKTKSKELSKIQDKLSITREDAVPCPY